MIQDGTCLADVFTAAARSLLQLSDSQSPRCQEKPGENQKQNFRLGNCCWSSKLRESSLLGDVAVYKSLD